MTNDKIIQPLFNPAEDPMAGKCRDAIKRACIAPADAPRLVQCDAKGQVKSPAPNQTLNLHPFPDGVLFRYSPNSARPGSYLIHDAHGLVVALAMTQDIADIIVRGCHTFFQMAQAEIKAQDEAAAIEVQPAEATNTTGAVISGNSVVDELQPHNEEAEYEKQLVRLSPPAIPSQGPPLPPHEVPSSGGIQYKMPLGDTD